ncbi:AraC family transcriptional regulator [Bacillus sp. Y1]|nr:AraC family transcriptional regulator [Bacillus sp. Y1]AYA77940.1 AraC family transcriptional regulator [Bacillus sp. Y1]
MEYAYEWVETDGLFPIKIIYHVSDEAGYIPNHWHESIEISYVLSGKIEEVYVDGRTYTSREGDIVVINSNSIHSFTVDRGTGRKAISVFIPPELLREKGVKIDEVAFDCVSVGERDEDRLQQLHELRMILDKMTDAYLSREKDHFSYVKITALSYELLYVLLKYFQVPKERHPNIHSKKHLDRLAQIFDYIKENYQQKLSLTMIADEFGITSEYLSRFFTKHIGVTLLHYINAVRLEFAHRDLVNTDLSILEIALKNGFPNEKSFNRVFKSVYKLAPSQYRRESKVPNQELTFF